MEIDLSKIYESFLSGGIESAVKETDSIAKFVISKNSMKYLRDEAKRMGLKGYSKMKKQELVDLIYDNSFEE